MWRPRVLGRGEPNLEVEDPASLASDPAISIVDEALAAFACRELVSADEAVDRLLDLRNALVAATTLRELEMNP